MGQNVIKNKNDGFNKPLKCNRTILYTFHIALFSLQFYLYIYCVCETKSYDVMMSIAAHKQFEFDVLFM